MRREGDRSLGYFRFDMEKLLSQKVTESGSAR